MLSKTKIKYIQSLGQKKFRQQEGLFIAEGPKLVSELLLENPSMVVEVFAVSDWINENKKKFSGIHLKEISGPELEKISQLSTPNKVLAVVKQFITTNFPSAKGQVVLALDDIQDPGNMGTIIRTADWYGLKQIVCSHHSADIYNPKVVQATMGSIARVQVFFTDLAHWLKKEKDIRIYAATLEGRDVSTVGKVKEGVIIIGNESKGIHPDLLALANVKFTIPRIGEAESLNAAVAAGIILCLLR
jgi:TrmH family RNA methyltransferase